MAKAINAELLVAGQAKIDPTVLSEYDLIGFGSGIYRGKHHESLFDLVENLPAMGNKKAFIFSPCGMGKLAFVQNWHKTLKEKLLGKGFEITGEFSCRGFNTVGLFKLIGGTGKGKPDKEDLRQAEDFARSLKL